MSEMSDPSKEERRGSTRHHMVGDVIIQMETLEKLRHKLISGLIRRARESEAYQVCQLGDRRCNVIE